MNNFLYLLRSITLTVMLVIGVSSVTYGQLTSQINGTITDGTGAMMPEVGVTVINENTGIRWEVKTNQSGAYLVPLLQPGQYRINVQAQGFKPVSRTGVRLDVAQTATINFALEVGALVESIEVKDTTPILDTGSNSIGGLVSPEKIENMPMKGRNSNSLLMLVPGIRSTRATTSNPVLESHYQFFSVNGSRPNQSQFTLDGGNNTNLTFNGPEYSAQVDSVQEFRVQTSNFSAEYANSAGGIINVVTKSGTNEFHGSAFEYFRNDALAANDFFSNAAGKKRPVLRYNQFGGTVGGPVIKNRSFFFFGYEGLRMKLPSVITTSVPTAAQKAGDFSSTLTSTGQVVAIYDPLTTRIDPNNAANYVRTPFAGNRIPANRIDAVSANVQSYYPAANQAGDPFTGLNNFFFSGPQQRSTNDFSGRFDHQLNQSTNVMVRVSRFNLSPWTNPATFGESNIASPGYVTKPQHHPNTTGKLTKAFTPTLFGEFLVSWARWYYESFALSNGFDPTKLGFPAYLAANSKTLGFPSIAPGEMSGLGTYYNEHDVSDRYEFKANLSKISGRHTIKFGGLYGLGLYTSRLNNNSDGTYSFDKSFTQGPNPLVSSPAGGFGYASFLLGTLSGGTHNPSVVDGAFKQPYYGLYVQDDFKLTPHFSLNLGLRWDYEAPRTEEKNQVTNFDYTSAATLSNGVVVHGGTLFPGVNGVARGHWNTSKTNFAPRFGFSYSIKDDTVIRGGYGIFYANTWGNGRNNNAIPQTGFYCSTAVINSLDGGLTPYSYLSNPFPSGFCAATGSSAGLATNLGQTINMIDRNLQLPYMQTWNLNIQRKLPGDALLEVAYSGSRGIHLMAITEYNQMAPEYMSLGTKLNSQVPNPYYGVITTGTLSTPTMTLAQSLRPYPQYTGVSSRNATYGASTYHALFVKAERRMSKGFSVLASYTFSKLIDDMIPSVNGFPGESFAGGGLQNYYNRRGERALASWNTPQMLVTSFVYELPFGQGKPLLNHGGLLGRIVGGWEVNGISTLLSGPPLQVVGGNTTGAFSGTTRPNWNGKDATRDGAVQGRLASYFDTSVFTLNDPYTFGNAPRIMPNLYGPGTANFDLSVFKNTTITEGKRLQFRAEAFNAFNRVQFSNPNTTITSNAFGRISGQQNSPRDIQLALKFLF
ncbi:MAG: TonB-dependent receptor [Acidobacteria bacterium]|nr:TonB-dependent receptor [Acidobacteriota bacterium]